MKQFLIALLLLTSVQAFANEQYICVSGVLPSEDRLLYVHSTTATVFEVNSYGIPAQNPTVSTQRDGFYVPDPQLGFDSAGYIGWTVGSDIHDITQIIIEEGVAYPHDKTIGTMIIINKTSGSAPVKYRCVRK
jgi:hypothetical protein